MQWNEKVNLTGITQYDEILIRHFLDSLSVILALDEDSAGSQTMLDIGTGAGFPGIPLRLVMPQLRLTLMDSVGKKITFLNALLPKLSLDKVEVVLGRAEDAAHLPEHREAYHYVVSRGVGKLSTLAEYTLPFCEVGGKAIAMKQGDLTDELTQATSAIERLGGRLERVVPVNIEALPEGRQLVVLSKIAPTPAQFPRRAGIPAKRPL